MDLMPSTPWCTSQTNHRTTNPQTASGGAFERDSSIPVVAITDEPPATLDAFFTKYDGPFPAIVAIDELRRSLLAYGVSGPPTFVLADATGKVQSIASGYRADTGLPVTGWAWSRRSLGACAGRAPVAGA